MISALIQKSARILVIAPHPDDESLAAGELLAAAASAGAATSVVFVTNGDNNPWPQRWSERHWNISEEDRKRWGRLRRQEACEALRALGVPEDSGLFLNYPDQGITGMLMRGDHSLTRRLAGLIRQWRPTLLAAPSLEDLHPDHSATAVYVRQAVASAQPSCRLSLLEYVVHGQKRVEKDDRWQRLPCSTQFRDAKRSAILRHETQLHILPGRLLDFAECSERYFITTATEAPIPLLHPVSLAEHSTTRLHLAVSLPRRASALGPMTLCVAGNEDGRATIRLRVHLPFFVRTSCRDVVDLCASGKLHHIQFNRSGGTCVVSLDSPFENGAHQLFVKVERPVGFLDGTGWREISLLAALREEGLNLPALAKEVS